MWKIKKSKTGALNLCFTGLKSKSGRNAEVCLYSNIDPRKTAESFYRNNFKGRGCYIIVGAGLFYHIKPFIDNPLVEKLVVVEPQKAIIDLVQSSNPGFFDSFFKENDVELVYGEKNVGEFIKAIRSSYDLLFYSSINVLILPSLERYFPETYKKIGNDISAALNFLLNNAVTISKFSKRWINNFKGNVKTGFQHLYRIKNIKNRYRGSCFVAAAGPTLGKFIRYVKASGRDLFIIAVDAAARPLLLSGIRPAVVVNIDPQPYVRLHFTGIERVMEDIPGILQPMSYPGVFNLFKTGFLMFNGHPISRLFGVDEKDEIMDYRSIATYAVRIASYMGFERIYLTGYDYSFVDYALYVNGGFWDLFSVGKSNRFNTRFSIDIDYLTGVLDTTDIKNPITNSRFLGYKTELEELIKTLSDSIKFYRLFPSPISIEGVRDVKDIEDVDSKYIVKSEMESPLEENRVNTVKRLDTAIKDIEDELRIAFALHYRIKKGMDRKDSLNYAGRDIERLYRIINYK